LFQNAFPSPKAGWSSSRQDGEITPSLGVKVGRQNPKISMENNGLPAEEVQGTPAVPAEKDLKTVAAEKDNLQEPETNQSENPAGLKLSNPGYLAQKANHAVNANLPYNSENLGLKEVNLPFLKKSNNFYEGDEAKIFFNPDDPDHVYKQFDILADGSHEGRGYGNTHYCSKPENSDLIDARVDRSINPNDLYDKVKVINDLGVKTNVEGITKDGSIIVKQEKIIPGNKSSLIPGTPSSGPSATIQDLMRDHPNVHAIPEGVFGSKIDPNHAGIVFNDGHYWLIDDVNSTNLIKDRNGKFKLVDANVSKLDGRLSPELQKHLDRLTRDYHYQLAH
jgi:hypothetical protein